MADRKKPGTGNAGARAPEPKANPEQPEAGNGAAASEPAQETTNAAGAVLLKKISPKTILGDKPGKFAPKKDEPAVDIFSVYGIANGIKTGETQFGEWEAMTGAFEATRVSDGKRFQAGSCFMPGAAGDLLLGGLKAAKAEDPDASVQFAIMVGIEYMERQDGTDGYKFTTREIVKVQQRDALSDLRGKALAALPPAGN